MQIHVARAGKELGAFSQEEVRTRLASGEFQPTDHGWAEGQGDWKVLSAFPGLIEAKPAAVLPPPPVLEFPSPEQARPNVRRQKKEKARVADPEPEPAPVSLEKVEPQPAPAKPADVILDLSPELKSPLTAPSQALPADPPPPTEPELLPTIQREPEPIVEPPSEPAPTVTSTKEPAAETIIRLELKPIATEERAQPEQRESLAEIMAAARAREASPAPRVITPPPPPETSREAVASMILGILSITLLPVLTPIPAVILGKIARERIDRSRGHLQGSGAATVGIVTGYLGSILAAFALIAAIVIAVTGFVQTKGTQTLSLENARRIYVACRMYSSEHGGQFPKTLESLVPNYLPDGQVLVCPFTGPSEPIGYEYFGGKESDPSTKILLVSKGFTARKRQVVVSVDGDTRLARVVPGSALHAPAP